MPTMVQAEVKSSVHGYPRIGNRRELKKATEAYWRGELDASGLQSVAKDLRAEVWTTMRDAGIDYIPSNTFSLYDHIADAIALFDAIPSRHRGGDELTTYFAMCRGNDDVSPLEMTKWFDTNYHYLVPEIAPDTQFRLTGTKPVDEYNEAKALGIETRPVLVGPLTFLMLAKTPATLPDQTFSPIEKIDDLINAYAELLGALHAAGVEWVQFDESAYVQDRTQAEIDLLRRTYERLCAVENRPKISIATYFGHVKDALPTLNSLAVEGLALDFSQRGAGNLEAVESLGGIRNKRLFAGVVDGRNVWTNDFEGSLSVIEKLKNFTDELVISTSCSLLHVPLDIENENRLSIEFRPWLAFARQKLEEVCVLSKAASGKSDVVSKALEQNRVDVEGRRNSPYVVDKSVRSRLAAVKAGDDRRVSPFADRVQAQHKRFELPLLPTTTIGSFPQTAEIRAVRSAYTKGEIDLDVYEARLRDEITHVVELQENIGIDVLVHGEAERNDMVQYFAEQLAGCITTLTGWVQSYGTRYVRPPIIAGDVSRPKPMTVRWSQFAQSITDKPMKGMLTGPVTMLCWSFVRDDIPWGDTAAQMALALRDEVNDLESAGIGMIQVDEPALREGLPLRQADQAQYLESATRAFRLSTAGVADETQIHTHMCYAEFGEIVDSVAALDADVISLEAARSAMTIADELVEGKYLAEVGPGVYDIHSPRVPSVDEIAELLRYAVSKLQLDQVWVNPDCGLKTRNEPEVVAALTNMVQATRIVRAERE